MHLFSRKIMLNEAEIFFLSQIIQPTHMIIMTYCRIIIQHSIIKYTYQLTWIRLLNRQPLLNVVNCAQKGKNGVFEMNQGFQKYHILPHKNLPFKELYFSFLSNIGVYTFTCISLINDFLFLYDPGSGLRLNIETLWSY